MCQATTICVHAKVGHIKSLKTTHLARQSCHMEPTILLYAYLPQTHQNCILQTQFQ
jgi:hypothetical protein